MSYVQETVDVEYIGRVFSVVKTVALLLVPAGTLLSSCIFGMNYRFAVFISGIGVIVVGIINNCNVKLIKRL